MRVGALDHNWQLNPCKRPVGTILGTVGWSENCRSIKSRTTARDGVARRRLKHKPRRTDVGRTGTTLTRAPNEEAPNRVAGDDLLPQIQFIDNLFELAA